MIAWMVYSLIVGLCVCVAAAAADWLCRVRRWPVRFAWIAAAVLCVGLSATARLREERLQPVDASLLDLSLARVQTSVLSVQQHAPTSSRWFALGLWGSTSLLVALAFIGAYARVRRARRAWPSVDLYGVRARVSPNFGPMVVGIVRPEIVVPRWAVDCAPDELSVMIAHETEHIRARDPLVLAGACALTALMPWNPALWIVLSRIRLATEIDCDARVLRGGVSPRVYGSLLIDVAERTPPLRFATMALSDGSSHLHQRILAMHPRHVSHLLARGMSVALVGLAGLLAACEAKMPTAADIDKMDAASAERSVRSLGLLPTDSSLVWLIDGVVSTAAAAKALSPGSIAEVSVNKAAPDGAHIDIVTKLGRQSAVASVGESGRLALRRKLASATGDHDPLRTAMETNRPLILINGVRSDRSAFSTLDRTQIEAIEVLKGPSAIKEYGDDAKNGVIVVKTKR